MLVFVGKCFYGNVDGLVFDEIFIQVKNDGDTDTHVFLAFL